MTETSDEATMSREGPRRENQRRDRVDQPRLAAYDVLVAVREEDAYANLVLPRLLRERGITGRDAAFVTELVGGTLRGQGSYDAVIDHLAGRGPDAGVRDALRLGAHQLLGMRVPDHAAVTSTVELVRTRVGHKPAGFTNALMRRISTRDLPEWMEELDASAAVRFSHPQWVVDELARALDRPQELETLLAADNERPRVTLVARPGLATVEELAGPAVGASTGSTDGLAPVSPLAVVLESGDPGEVPAVREGRAGVQDAGSQLVALVLSRAAVDGRDDRWLDLCAGPGGKAALLAALATQSWATGPGHPGGKRRSTVSWSTRPARASARCAVAPRAAGVAARRTSVTWCPCSGRCWTALWTRSGPVGSSSTRRARRRSPRRRAWCAPYWSTGRTWSSRTPPPSPPRRWTPSRSTCRAPYSCG